MFSLQKNTLILSVFNEGPRLEGVRGSRGPGLGPVALPAAGEAGSQHTWSLHSPGESGSHTTVPRSCAQRGMDETQPREAMSCCLIFCTMRTLVGKCVPWWTVPPPRQSCPPLDAFHPGCIPLYFLSIPFWVVIAEQLPLPALPPQTVSVQGGSAPRGSHCQAPGSGMSVGKGRAGGRWQVLLLAPGGAPRRRPGPRSSQKLCSSRTLPVSRQRTGALRGLSPRAEVRAQVPLRRRPPSCHLLVGQL